MAGKRKKRLRIFAGPNGSGKSSLYQNFPPNIRLGVYVNADEIEKTLRQSGRLNLEAFKITSDIRSLKVFLDNHPMKEKIHDPDSFAMVKNTVIIKPENVSSYWAAMLSDYIRKKLVQDGRSLSFETVLSSPDKIEFIRFARKKGYKIYLYYICTEDPDINIDRINYRVSTNRGHFVLNKKVKERYHKSLGHLFEAIELCYRGYLFDNSGEAYWLCAERTPKLLKVCGHSKMPVWLYQHLLVKNFESAKQIPLRKLN